MITKQHTAIKNITNARGGIALMAGIALITLVLIVGAVVMLLRSHEAEQKVSHRKADQICDSGLTAALDSINNPLFNGSILKTGEDGGTYQVTFTRIDSNDSLLLTIVSEGIFASQVVTKRCVLARALADTGTNWIRREMQ